MTEKNKIQDDQAIPAAASPTGEALPEGATVAPAEADKAVEAAKEVDTKIAEERAAVQKLAQEKDRALDKERELNPANAAREAVFSLIRDTEMPVDDKMSAVAPLLKTINEHRMVKGPDLNTTIDEDQAPRAGKRYSMLGDDAPPLVDNKLPDVFKPPG